MPQVCTPADIRDSHRDDWSSTHAVLVRLLLGCAFVACFLGGVDTARAQTLSCPHPDPVCFPTTGGCTTQSFQWPPDYCGCGTTNPFFSVDCVGSQSGAGCGPGQPGCIMSCWTVQTAWPCTTDYERTGTPACASGGGPGAPPPPTSQGMPVSLTTGEMFLTHTDAKLGALVFSRTYNTQRLTSAGRYGSFGRGWNTSFEERLRSVSARTIERRLPDGTPVYYFDPENDGIYRQESPHGPESWIETLSPGHKLHHRAGGFEIFDVNGRIVSRTEPGGIETTYTRDGSGRLTAVTRLGRSLILGYDGESTQPSTLSGPPGLIATYTYYADGQLKTVTYADGNADGLPDGGYTYNYVSFRLTSVKDADGKTIETHEYWADGKAKTSEVADGREKLTFTYSLGVTTVTDALTPANVTTYEWANVKHIDRVTKVTGPCSSCGGGGGETQEWTYNSDGWISAYEDGEGNVTTYTYDPPTGDLLTETRIVDPEVAGSEITTTYTYYTDGRVHTRTGPNDSITTYTYVAAGPQTITQTINSTETRQFRYDYTTDPPIGLLSRVTDPYLKATDLHYTSAGDLDWVRDPLDHVTSFDYDTMGRRTKTHLPATSPPNDSPTTSYDSLGRVWRVTNPNTSYWEYKYDGDGHKKSVRDPYGKLTSYFYDDWGRLTKVIDPLLGETEYGYDLMSNLTSLTDARDKTTTFEYDGHHRVKKVTYPGATKPVRFEEFTYDPAGRLKTRKDRKGVTTTYAYDGIGRLKGKTYSDGSPAVTFGYDANGDAGFMTSASNSADSLTWDYDLAGQLLSEASTRNSTTVSYLYDLAGRRSHLRLNGLDVLTYAYHDDGELNMITREAGVVFDFNPDAAHRRQSVVFPNGTTTEYGYDSLSRLTLLRLKRGAIVLNDIAYESNNLDNRISRTENGTRLEYEYDDLSRLEWVDRTAPTPTARQEEYTYDSVGNRLTALAIPGTWTYSDRNELLSQSGITFGYDLNGNQVSRSSGPIRTYVWNVENRLTAARDADGATVAGFEYDPLGRRVAKTTSAGLTRFAYDGEDILFEQGPSESFTYLHGPGIDEPLAREDSAGSRTYYHADGLGSIVKRTDGSGNVIASQTYDSFGQAAGVLDGYAFTGREWDAPSGLYYNRARYYDARLGSFISQDPLGLKAGLNLYDYAFDNPTNYFDPTGESGSAAKSGAHGTHAIHITHCLVEHDECVRNIMHYEADLYPPGTGNGPDRLRCKRRKDCCLEKLIWCLLNIFPGLGPDWEECNPHKHPI